jgi:hypothetical protein
MPRPASVQSKLYRIGFQSKVIRTEKRTQLLHRTIRIWVRYLSPWQEDTQTVRNLSGGRLASGEAQRASFYP